MPRARLVGIALAVIALLIASCGPSTTPVPTGGPGPSATTTGEPSTEPSAAGSGGPAESPGEATPGPSVAASPKPTLAFQVNTAVRVTVSVLNVREWPRTTAKKNGTLAKGDVVVLLGYGGIKAGGYTWFEAARIKGLHGPLPALPAYPLEGGTWTDLTGWIAVGTGSTAYVAPLPLRCGDDADLATLSAMLPGEQLACFGSTPLVLEGTFGCGGCGGAFPGSFKPEWLATPLSGFFSVSAPDHIGPLQLYFPPDVARPEEGQILRVRAHLDDARSSTCKVSIPLSDAFDAKLVALRSGDPKIWCRQHVVVDGYDVLGVDPSFPPS